MTRRFISYLKTGSFASSLLLRTEGRGPRFDGDTKVSIHDTLDGANDL
jgi:hypothetical protein